MYPNFWGALSACRTPSSQSPRPQPARVLQTGGHTVGHPSIDLRDSAWVRCSFIPSPRSGCSYNRWSLSSCSSCVSAETRARRNGVIGGDMDAVTCLRAAILGYGVWSARWISSQPTLLKLIFNHQQKSTVFQGNVRCGRGLRAQPAHPARCAPNSLC